MNYVLATANQDKVSELVKILGDDIQLTARPRWVPEVIEDSDSLVGNARLKARALLGATETASLADDTGLFVDALGGDPGVLSARFAGEGASYADNVAALLDAMAGMENRRCEFRTAAFMACPCGAELWVESRLAGSIAGHPLGTGGFGYDPVFLPEGGGGRSFSEMTPEEKNASSHRFRAFSGLGILLRFHTHP